MQLDPHPVPARILMIAAHPDDIEFGAAGAAAVWSEAGAEVHYCIVTDGSAGSNAADYDRDRLIRQRIDESLEAAAVVGVRHVHFLGYTDGVLQPTIDLRRDLTRLIRRLRPGRVVIMDPTTRLVGEEGFDYINHPDHVAAGEASLYAVFPSAETRPIFPELLAEGLEPHHVDELYLMLADKAQYAVDISAVIERKKQALLSHRSQLTEDDLEFIFKFDAAAGAEVGVSHAETFRVMRFLR
jgi:LmbE family N-acetylglucosaminyl deacetylase